MSGARGTGRICVDNPVAVRRSVFKHDKKSTQMAGSGSRLPVDSPSPAEQTSSPQRRQHEPAFRGSIATEPTTHGNNGITPARYVSLLGTIRDNVREIVAEQWQPCDEQAWNQVLGKVVDPDACCPKVTHGNAGPSHAPSAAPRSGSCARRANPMGLESRCLTLATQGMLIRK